MNYRHSFHAGAIADVVKHYVLVLVLQALQQKDTPLCVLDTHAGSGVYSLRFPGEFAQGIGRLWPERAKWPTLAAYFAVIETFNTGAELRNYPGSPVIISELLRWQDRAVFIEKNAAEYDSLAQVFSGRKNIALHCTDAWLALKGLVPPRENRGLVLIDQPFEQESDFDNILVALKHAQRHWRNGCYLIWYPVKQLRPVARMHATIRTLGMPIQAVEFTTLPTDVEQRLNGSGLIMLNPPWKLVETLQATLPALAEHLAGLAGRAQVRFMDLA